MLNVNSRFQSILSVSLVGGTLGLALAESVFSSSAGGIGFVVGAIGSFMLVSVMAVVSDIGESRTGVRTNLSISEQSQQVAELEKEQSVITASYQQVKAKK